MINDNIENAPKPRRLVTEDEGRSHLVRPQRNPDRLFTGWGPKL